MFETVRDPRYLSEEFIPKLEKWYCLHCIDASPFDSSLGWITEASVRQHCKNAHGEEDVDLGRDYATGDRLRVYLLRWRAGNMESVSRFSRFLNSSDLYGLEDFLLDLGPTPEGLPS